MFDSLSGKLQNAFKNLRGLGKISESNVSDALREVRMALLEADVNFKVVKAFIDRVRSYYDILLRTQAAHQPRLRVSLWGGP